MDTFEVATPPGSALVDVTDHVRHIVTAAGMQEGICVIFVPHTTAGLTMNENWDPDVQHDVLLTMGHMAPVDPLHRHSEGNSPAHVKSSLFGASQVLIVSGGKLQLGRWQGVYLCEFDGPRRRDVWVKLLPDR